MPLPRRSSRRTYNRVSGDTSEASGVSLSSGPASLNEPLAPEHQLPDSTAGRDHAPSPLTAQTSADGGNDASSTLTSPNPLPPTAAPSPPPSSSCSTSPTPMENPINVVVLDSAHSKFNIAVSPEWTVAKFKSVGSTIHRVPPKSQRLIHMGKLLQDDQTLEYYGITESNKIIHLFPKPNVVVTTSSNSTVSSTGGSGRDDDDDDEEEQGEGATSGGAHVPQIILDAAEAERRSQILILSSSEIFEAQHRVKLLSFLLLIICAMELLTLFTIALGVPQDDGTGGENGYDDDYYVPPGDPTDPASSSSGGGGGRGSGDGMAVRTWQNSDYADLVISSFGFYVATLGIKATTENTVLLARKYFVCLVVVGVAWNAYYYVMNLRVARKEAIDRRGGGGDASSSDDGDGISESQIRTQAMFAIMLPVFVWCICFLRAWQFQRLIQEAEEEAEERARRLTAGDDADGDDEDEHHGSTRSGSGDGGGRRSSDGPRDQGVEVVAGGTDSSSLSSSRVVPYGSGDDLVLQVEGRVIT